MSALSDMLATPAATQLGLLLVFLFVALRAFTNWRTLRHFEGPRLAKFGRGWLFWHSLHARVNRAQCEALQRYGECRPALTL